MKNGLTGTKGLSGSYRYMAYRPANEDYSTIAKGYFVTDAAVSYKKNKTEVEAIIQNLLNIQWKETHFDTESRLRNEPVPVTEIHFTPRYTLFPAAGSYL